MAQLFDHIEYLSREIGARPAGTEEEQQAALYIADQLQREAGFHAEIEEFTSSSNLEGARAIPAVVIVLVVVLAMLFNVLTIPALVLAVAATAIYAMEALGRPLVSGAFARGASQNVVAKYQPSAGAAGQDRHARTRKIVLVAHYDSGKVKPRALQAIESHGLPLGLVVIGGMAASVLFLLLRVFLGGIGGVPTIILNILSIVALVPVLLPVVKAIMYRVAPYNEGANNNASGVAAVIEVASRISKGSVSEADLAAYEEEAVMHGEEALRETGLVPEGVEISYDDRIAAADPADAYTEEERLLAAKAAIAALTGRPVESHVFGSPAPSQTQAQPDTDARAYVPQEEPGQDVVAEPGSADGGENREATVVQPAAATVAAVVTAAADAVQADGFENAPSWFVAAQRNAKRPSGEVVPSQRSRYNQAIDNAEREAAERELARQEQERAVREAALNAAAKPAAEPQPEPASQPEFEPQPESQSVPEPVQPPSQTQSETEPPAEAPSTESAAVADQPQLDPGMTVAYKPFHLQESMQAPDPEPEEPVALESQLPEPEPMSEPTPEPTSEPELEPTEEPAPASSRPALAGLPSIEGDNDGDQGVQAQSSRVPENANPSRSGMFRKLRTDVPSLSGVIRMQQAGEDVSQKPIAKPAAHPAADTVDYDMNVSQLESLAAPAKVAEQKPEPELSDIPTSRAGGLLGKLRKKGPETLEETPQQWLDVNEDFDARTVGKERGSWESFRDESAGQERSWNGGGFSRVHLDYVDTRSGDGAPSDTPDELVESTEDRILNEEIGHIMHFRNPQYNNEVWFVAIGSDTELHDGAREFVNAHRNELRGAMVIEVESLGAGALSVASEEGQFRKTKASSRIKRFIRPTVEATGIVPEEVAISGADSIATTIQKEGFQAMHLFGAENGEPALKGSADDVVENVDELTLEENVGFLMELLRRA